MNVHQNRYSLAIVVRFAQGWQFFRVSRIFPEQLLLQFLVMYLLLLLLSFLLPSRMLNHFLLVDFRESR